MKELLPTSLPRRLEAVVSVGDLEYTIQTWVRYRTLSQACDCHGIFVGRVIILNSVKMTVWMSIDAHLTGFTLNWLETVLKWF